MLVMVGTIFFTKDDYVICNTNEMQIDVDRIKLVMNASSAAIKPNDFLVNLNQPNGVLNVVYVYVPVFS